MEHSPYPVTTIPFTFEGEKRLSSKDRIWIVTDVHAYTSRIFDWATPQQWYRVGALCLETTHLAIVEFTTDDMRQIIKALMAGGAGSAPPWKMPQQCGLEMLRFSHGNQEGGRFRQKVNRIELEPDLLKHGPDLHEHFESKYGLHGNLATSALQDMAQWAQRENRIETAALSLEGWFSAGMVKEIVGHDSNVSPTLARLVEEGALIPNGKVKRGARYMKTPPVTVDRADWNG
jgi:hypothetical protein